MKDTQGREYGPASEPKIPKLDIDWLITGNRILKNNHGGALNIDSTSSDTKSVDVRSAGNDGEHNDNESLRLQRTKSAVLNESSRTKDHSTLRRTTSLTTDNSGHSSDFKRKSGFFGRIFSKRKSRPSRDKFSRGDTYGDKGKQGGVDESFSMPFTTANSLLQNVGITYGLNNHDSRSSVQSKEGVPTREDSKLDEFLKYYKTIGFSNFPRSESNDSHVSPCVSSDSVDYSRGKAIKSVEDENASSRPSSRDSTHFGAPQDVSKPKLRPILKRGRNYPRQSSPARKKTDSSTNKFGLFVKRVTSQPTDDSSSFMSSASSINDYGSCQPTGVPPVKFASIPGLESLRPLKRVAFAKNTYFNNPPQQICSRNPRKGEVEIKQDGSVIIHRLTAEEKRQVLQNSSCGVVVGGSRHLQVQNHPNNDEEGQAENHKSESSEATPNSPQKSMDVAAPLDDARKRSISKGAAEAAAEARAKATPLELTRMPSNNEEDVTVDGHLGNVTIDKPMVTRRIPSSADSNSMSSLDYLSDSEVLPPPRPVIPNNVLYTRCCYLREILPIPATLKQLKKDDVGPIPLLQLRNPKPSIIEILSFSDFLSVAPILCLSLDGVSLSVEMFRIILSSLTYKNNFEKLSLRNTPIDDEGWKVLSYFISRCRSLRAIDLSMVIHMHTNVQKPSKSSRYCTIPRMSCNMTSRSDRNWDLFTAAVATNGKLEEIILSGAHISVKQFSNFIEYASYPTERLGLAYNDLSNEHCQLVSNWILQSKAQGLDLGFNDLNGKLRPVTDALMRKAKSQTNGFKFVSLNSTNLEIPQSLQSDSSEVVSLFSALGCCENLRFLDLSNNPKMFIYGIGPVANLLPVFLNLVRLQLDYNNLSSTDIITLAELLPLCKNLNHVSILGSKLDLSSSTALVMALKKSTTLFTLEADYEDIPDRIKEKISLYSLKNMDKILELAKTGEDPYPALGLQEELALLLTEKIEDKDSYSKVVLNFAKKIYDIRARLRKITEDLFDLRVRGELNTEGKESLVRLCFIDACFEKGLKLLSNRYQRLLGNTSESDFFNQISGLAVQGDVDPWEQHSTECLRHIASVTSISSMSFHENGQAALLPFNQPPLDTTGPADDTIELRTTRSAASRHIKQDKEEGAFLKKTQGVMKGIRSSSNGKSICDDTLKHVSHEYNCEMIKDFVLNHDISEIIETLDELQRQGVTLNDVFKKPSNLGNCNHEGTQLLKLDDSEGDTDITFNSQAEDSKEPLDEEEDEEEHIETRIIDRVYDEVLDKLEQARIHMESG